MEFRGLIGWIFAVFGSFYAVLSVPLVAGWVPMNKFGYGFPFASALASEKSWYAINRYGGILSVGLGLVLTAIGAFILIGPRFSELLLIPLFPVPPAAIALSYFLVYRYGQRYQRQ